MYVKKQRKNEKALASTLLLPLPLKVGHKSQTKIHTKKTNLERKKKKKKSKQERQPGRSEKTYNRKSLSSSICSSSKARKKKQTKGNHWLTYPFLDARSYSSSTGGGGSSRQPPRKIGSKSLEKRLLVGKVGWGYIQPFAPMAVWSLVTSRPRWNTKFRPINGFSP